MAKLNINLLPPELEAEKKQKSSFSSAIRYSIFFLVAVIGIAVVVLSVRLSQNVVLTNINKDLETAKTTLNSPDYNKREGLVITLKNRLESIGTLLTQDTFGSYAYNLISGLVGPEVQLSSFDVDSQGVVKVTAVTNSISALEAFLNQVVTPQSNQNKVQTATIEGINRSKTDLYNTDLTILLVGGKAK